MESSQSLWQDKGKNKLKMMKVLLMTSRELLINFSYQTLELWNIHSQNNITGQKKKHKCSHRQFISYV